MPILTLLHKHKFGAAPAAPANWGDITTTITADGAEGEIALAGTATGTLAKAGKAKGSVKAT